jgi:TRAP-type C4-dicarboxylate transport system substrate-binding protein
MKALITLRKEGGRKMGNSRKHLFFSWGFILVSFMVWGLGGTGYSWAEAPIKLRYFTGMPPSHHFCTKDMVYFKNEVEKRTNGRVQVQLYPAGQLFSFIQGIDAATMGGVEMGLTAIGHWAGYSPVFKFSDFFLLIEDFRHWERAKGSIDQILQPVFAKQNVKILFYSAYGGNSLCGKKQINQPEDMKGLKIRAPVPGALASLAAWGASPTRIASSEVYDALAKGAIDGCVTSWSFMNAQKLYEVSDYYVGPFWWTVWVNLINMDTWQNIPGELQKIILQVSKDTEKLSPGWMQDYENESLAKLKEKGSVKILTPPELKAWGKPLIPVYEAWVKECTDKGSGKEAKEIIKALNATR